MITPELTVSDDSLTFARTVVGKPVFLVLRVTADERNVQVIASTDRPDVFQLADDNRPLFNNSLALVPEPTGTYVHIRYLPTRAGTHEATLTLESALGTRTVSLTGRSGRLPTLNAPANNTLTRTIVRRRSRPIAGRIASWLGSAVLLTGLIYAGITYRCTLIPSLCRENVVSSPVVPTSASPDRPEIETTPAIVSKPARPVKVANPAPDKAATRETDPVQVVRRADPIVAAEPVVANEPTGRPTEKPRSSTRPTAPKITPSTPAVVAPVRLPKAGRETGESELERELNGHTD